MIRKYIHKSITGNTAVELIAKESDVDYDIHSMTICNTHTTDLLDIDIYIQYLNPKSHFPGKNAKLGASDSTVDIIINLKNI